MCNPPNDWPSHIKWEDGADQREFEAYATREMPTSTWGYNHYDRDGYRIAFNNTSEDIKNAKNPLHRAKEIRW